MKRTVLCAISLLSLISTLSGATDAPKTVSLPIVFEKNVGQAAAEYQYLSRHGQVETLFSVAGVDFRTRNSGSQVRLHLMGARENVMPEGRGSLPSVTNYLLGNDPSRWVRSVANDAEVVYHHVYPGIDLVFRGTGDQMEHDFRIAAGSDPRLVRFSFDGAEGIKLDSAGKLNVLLGDGVELTFNEPIAYQETAHGKSHVSARFVLSPDGGVRFRIGAYDRKRELVIDPVFGFSTYLAGSSADYPTAITTDASGNVYVTGYTYSVDFPNVNGIDTTYSGSPDAFVSKLDPSGRILLYSTYLGGSARNYGSAIAIDAAGNIVVSGTSASNDFPHAGSVPPLTCEGNNDCFFIASLNSQGSAFNYAGLIGGIVGTSGGGPQGPGGVLALDSMGNAYLAGVTDDKNFEITTGTLSNSVPGYPYDSTFLLKVTSNGTLAYSTIIPGTDQQSLTIYLDDVFIPKGIWIDPNSQATIAGTAGPGLPSTNGVVQPTFPNPENGNASAGFVLKLNATASAINYATYVPGTDQIGALAVDYSGNSYVTGETSESNLPVSANAYQKSIRSGPNCTCNSGFILKLNGTGTAVLAATYLEGTPAFGNEGTSFAGIALDSHSNVFVGGMTGSVDFPLVNPFTSEWIYGASSADMVLAEMSPDLSSLLFGSFLSSVDQFFPASQFSAITVGRTGGLLVVGITDTTDFPTTPGSFQPTPPTQSNHGFVAKLILSTPAPAVCIDSWNLYFGSVLVKSPGSQTIHLTNCGNATLHVTGLVSSASTVKAKNTCGTVAPGGVCALALVYTPQDMSSIYGQLVVKDDAPTHAQVITYSGQGVAPQILPSSGSFNLGHILVNIKTPPTSYFFFNYGSYPLTVTSAFADGDFHVMGNTCTGTVEVYGYCWVNVSFAPTAPGIRTGTLTVISNDPINSRVGISLVGFGDTVYAPPLIAGLDTSTAQIYNGPITIQVTGANFYPDSVVQAKGIPQATTYLGNGELEARLGADVMGTIGEVPITVFNRTPGGGISAPIPITPFHVLNLTATSLASAPGSETVYASLPSWSPTNPNTVTPINPMTGATGTPIQVGNDPGLLGLSGNGKYLFVVANQDQTIQRINLATNTVEQTFNFPPNNCSYCGMQTAVDLKVVPGSAETFVLALTGEVALYNAQGLVNYVPATYSLFGDFTSFTFAGNPSAIYTLPFTNKQSNFFNVITMSPQGLNFTIPQLYGVNDDTGAQVVSDGQLLYTSSGEVWDPITQSQTGSFPLAILNASTLPNTNNVLVDNTSGHIFTVGAQNYQSYLSSMFLSAFGTESLGQTGSLTFPTIPQPYAQSLVRWGSDGFAFIAQAPNSSSEGVYVLTSSLATPVRSNPVPKIKSLSPSLMPQSGSDSQITLNGQGFTAASVVNFNGSPLQSTYIDGSVLTATIPAADLISSGTFLLTVSNPAPGGGNSNSISFTVSPPAPLASFSSTVVPFGMVKVGTISSARMIAVENPGTANLNISNIQITGANPSSFLQTNNCGTTLAPGANCAVYISFRPQVTGALGASLTFTDNAVGSPQSISLLGTGD